ncbi:hypothetical protein Tco_0563294 [Tanacetum coccineum]
MTFGKDKLNPFIVDSLLKTIRLSIHLVVYNEELAIPEQTATEGKVKENQGVELILIKFIKNGDLKNRSVWIHPPGLQDNYLKEQTLYKLKVKIYSVNDPTSGIRACVETLNKKNSIRRVDQLEKHCSFLLPPSIRLAKKLAVKGIQERVKSILLLAILDEYLLKFHNVSDAKSLWAEIKSRFGGNEESKKMQKNVLKHLFENFTTASNESLDKAYDRFQKLISQLEVHSAPISKEDINQKFLRSLPPSWNQIALIMRNKPDIDEIDIDDLYNNLKVYEDEMKRSSSSTSTSQNLKFLSSKNTSSTNEVSTASGDFGIDEDDLEELDLRWQVAMLTGTLLENADLEGNQGEKDLYGDNGGAMYQQIESSLQALVAQDGLGGYECS